MGFSVKTVKVSFGLVDHFTEGSVLKYEEALLLAQKDGIKVRGIILCSPHNPLGGHRVPAIFCILTKQGRCYPRNVLVEFLKLCQRYQIHLISDEIYALSMWENKDYPEAIPFTSILQVSSPDIIDPNLVHVLWGVSKVCHYLTHRPIAD